MNPIHTLLPSQKKKPISNYNKNNNNKNITLKNKNINPN